MLKELENKIKELKQLRANLKESESKLIKDEHYDYLLGYYQGERASLLDEIVYLQKVVKTLKGD